jgi:hypothetical protein
MHSSLNEIVVVLGSKHHSTSLLQDSANKYDNPSVFCSAYHKLHELREFRKTVVSLNANDLLFVVHVSRHPFLPDASVLAGALVGLNGLLPPGSTVSVQTPPFGMGYILSFIGAVNFP